MAQNDLPAEINQLCQPPSNKAQTRRQFQRGVSLMGRILCQLRVPAQRATAWPESVHVQRRRAERAACQMQDPSSRRRGLQKTPSKRERALHNLPPIPRPKNV